MSGGERDSENSLEIALISKSNALGLANSVGIYSLEAGTTLLPTTGLPVFPKCTLTIVIRQLAMHTFQRDSWHILFKFYIP